MAGPALPRVTVGLPVYNGERYLRAALDSTLGQTFTDFELIISDNASTDATERICREAAAADGRVRYIRQPRNLGAAPNYNLLVHQARGEFFRWIAHDDLSEPDLLAALVARLDACPEAVLAFSDTTLIDADGASQERYVHATPWRGGRPSVRLADLLLHDASYIHRCFPIFGLMRTEGLRDTRLIGAFEGADKVSLVELALRGDFAHYPEPLFSRREHDHSSRRAQVTATERLRWFDAAATARAPRPRATLARQYWAAVAHAGLTPAERWRCRAILGRWVASGRRWRVIAGELRPRHSRAEGAVA